MKKSIQKGISIVAGILLISSLVFVATRAKAAGGEANLFINAQVNSIDQQTGQITEVAEGQTLCVKPGDTVMTGIAVLNTGTSNAYNVMGYGTVSYPDWRTATSVYNDDFDENHSKFTSYFLAAGANKGLLSSAQARSDGKPEILVLSTIVPQINQCQQAVTGQVVLSRYDDNFHANQGVTPTRHAISSDRNSSFNIMIDSCNQSCRGSSASSSTASSTSRVTSLPETGLNFAVISDKISSYLK